MINDRLRVAFRAALIHLAISMVVASVVGVIVFYFWFPSPYRDIAGGLKLFLIIMGVDIVCGPILTFIVFNPKKSKKEISIDLLVIVFIQAIALGYGIHAISVARPVVLAFEVDRFVVVSAAEIDENELKKAKSEFQKLSWSGPVLVGTKLAENEKEMMLSLKLSLQGNEPSARPGWWRDYDMVRADVMSKMKKIENIEVSLNEEQKKHVQLILNSNGFLGDSIYYLPLVSREILDQWSVLLDEHANIRGFLNVDGFAN